MRHRLVEIRIPASTSNLGSGFDTLGLALELYNFVRLTRSRRSGVRLAKPGVTTARLSEIVSAAAEAFFARFGNRRFGIEVLMSGAVPPGRGLGASATARLGVVAGLAELTGRRITEQELLDFVTELEGHPDNASPAIYGGFTVSGRTKAGVTCVQFPVDPRLKCITLIPRHEMDTAEARKLVPASFSKSDTAHALNRAALITAAFASQRYESLRGIFDDRFHQPYREQLLPELSRVIAAGERAGAIGGFLSGAGSGIICLAARSVKRVAAAMKRQIPASQILVLSPTNEGFRVMRTE